MLNVKNNSSDGDLIILARANFGLIFAAITTCVHSRHILTNNINVVGGTYFGEMNIQHLAALTFAVQAAYGALESSPFLAYSTARFATLLVIDNRTLLTTSP